MLGRIDLERMVKWLKNYISPILSGATPFRCVEKQLLEASSQNLEGKKMMSWTLYTIEDKQFLCISGIWSYS